MAPIAKDQDAHGIAQLIPAIFSGGKLCAHLLIHPAGDFQHLVNQKGQPVQGEKNRRQMLLSMTEIVLDMVALNFQGVENFVFNFPATAAHLGQFDNIAGIYGDIGYPAIVIFDLPLFNNLIFREIDLITALIDVERQPVGPPVDVLAALDVG